MSSVNQWDRASKILVGSSLVCALLLIFSFFVYNNTNRLSGTWRLELCGQNEYVDYMAPYSILACDCANYDRKPDWSEAGLEDKMISLSQSDQEKLDYFGSCGIVCDSDHRAYSICTKDEVKKAYDDYLVAKFLKAP